MFSPGSVGGDTGSISTIVGEGTVTGTNEMEVESTEKQPQHQHVMEHDPPVAMDDNDEKPLRTGMRTLPVLGEVGKALIKEGQDTLNICVSGVFEYAYNQFCIHDFLLLSDWFRDTIQHTIRKWLHTVTPAIEEGNNTGVEIQELSLSHINSLHNLANDCLNFLNGARQARSILIRSYLRAPGIEDRLLTIGDADEAEIGAA